MEQGNYSVGLDIGTTKIVAIIGKENDYGKIEILGTGRSKSLGVHRGVVNNITQTISSIQQGSGTGRVELWPENRLCGCGDSRTTHKKSTA